MVNNYTETKSEAPLPFTASTDFTALAAYAIAKHGAILVGTKCLNGSVHFDLKLPGPFSLQEIEAEFNADGTVLGRLYADELSRLKHFCIKARKAMGATL